MNKEEYLKKKYFSKISSTKGRKDKNGDPIEFRLTFEEWKKLWEDSGRLPNRDYVLSRKNDIGHYELGNVYVNHNLLNVMETFTPGDEYEKKISQYAIDHGLKRRIVKAKIKRGELKL